MNVNDNDNVSRTEQVLKLAESSFGLIVPDNLLDIEPFNLFDLDDDQLLQVTSVGRPSQSVYFTSHTGDCYEIHLAEFEDFKELDSCWRKLTPTQ